MELKRTYIHPTASILDEINTAIKRGHTFSLLRLGSGLRTLMSVLSPGVMDGKLCKGGSEGYSLYYKLLRTEGIPRDQWTPLSKTLVKMSNEADYVDCWEAVYPFAGHEDEFEKRTSLLETMEMWPIFNKSLGITTKEFCSPYLHYFLFTDSYNLYTILKDRSVYCISDVGSDILHKLREVSGAKCVEGYRTPDRLTMKNWNVYKNVIHLIRDIAPKYDIFLTGAGFLGKLYCGEIKRMGGRVVDVGGTLRALSGNRPLEKRPFKLRQYIVADPQKFMFKRLMPRESDIW